MDTITLAQWQKIGFNTKVAGMKFVKESGIRKGRNQSIPNLLQEIRRARIDIKNQNIKTKKTDKTFNELGKLFDAFNHNLDDDDEFKVIKTLTHNTYGGKVIEKVDEYVPQPLVEMTVPIFSNKILQRYGFHLNEMGKTIEEVNTSIKIYFRILSKSGKSIRDRKHDTKKTKNKPTGEPRSLKYQNDEYRAKKESKNKILYKDNYGTERYINSSYEIISTSVIENDLITLPNLVVVLSKFINKNYKSEDYNVYVDSVKYMFRAVSQTGGCTSAPYSSNEYYIKISDGKLVKTTTEKNSKHVNLDLIREFRIDLRVKKSDNNNCLFACLNEFYDVKGHKEFNKKIRKLLNVGECDQIHINDVHRVVSFYNTKYERNYGFILANESSSDWLKILKTSNVKVNDDGEVYENTIPLFLYNEHYYLFKMKSYYLCETCKKKLSVKNQTHECNLNICSYIYKQLREVIVKKGENSKIDEYFFFDKDEEGDPDALPIKKRKNKDGEEFCVLKYDKLPDELKKEYIKIKNDKKIVEPHKPKEVMAYENVINKIGKRNIPQTNRMIETSLREDKDKIKIKLEKEGSKTEWKNAFTYYYNCEAIQIPIYIDFETFPHETSGLHQMYAIGVYNSYDKNYFDIYHEKENKSVDERFLDYLVDFNKSIEDLNLKNPLTGKSKKIELILCAFNGYRYDFHLMLQKIIERNINHDFVLSSGRLIKLDFLNYKVFDLCAFLSSSLEDACTDFKVSDDIKKSSFDFLRVRSYNDAIKEDVQKDCREYLRRDVMCMVDLHEKFSDIVFNKCHLSMYNFMTLPHLSYCSWTMDNKKVIKIPTMKQWKEKISKSIYGGRTYGMIREYKSEFYDRVKNCINNDELDKLYDEVRKSDDYIIYGDVTSLYPASMAGFDKEKYHTIPYKNRTNYEIKKINNSFKKFEFEESKLKFLTVNHVRYPYGKVVEIENNELECEYIVENTELLGIFEIEYVPPKIIYPVLPSKKIINNSACGLDWNVLPGKGFYTSIDIENAICMGYEIKYTGVGMYWEMCGDLFSKFVEEWYKIKDEAEKTNNSALKAAAKLFLNSLYGKLFQKPITEKTKIVTNIIEFDRFINDYKLCDFKYIGNDKYLLSGEEKDLDECMRKPSYLGGFVTAWSRRIMLYYVYMMDPTLTNHTYHYGDTDSLLIKAEYAKILIEKKLLLSKEEAKLGFLCFDEKKEAITLININLAPKSYYYEDFTRSSQLKVHMKIKGIPKEYMNPQDYITQKPRLIEFNNPKKQKFKKVCLRPTKDNIENNIGLFGIYTRKMERTFLKSEWKGFDLKDNLYYPKGYLE